jgi:AraC-like DNA-binding protein/mannose-6-phosphate isomerase-like protein (cupin superfamily)
MTKLASPRPDAVSEVLRSLAVRSTIFCLSELRAPWAFRVDGEKVPKFHLVLEGSAFLSCGGEPPLALGAGDLVLLPRGARHTLANDRATPTMTLERLLAEARLDGGSQLRYGGSGALTRLLCGGFSLADGVPEPALAGFPEVIRVGRHNAAATSWLEHVLATLKSEADDGLPGADALVAKLADVFLAQALRAWLIEAEPDALVGLGSIHDRPIAEALEALSSRPAEPWSLDRLAKHVGLSRTALAVRFRDRVGMPPMRYLTKLRLSQAAAYLATGHLSIQEIAGLAGYQSDATLSKAFKREFGQAPGAYRDRARQPPVIEIA